MEKYCSSDQSIPAMFSFVLKANSFVCDSDRTALEGEPGGADAQVRRRCGDEWTRTLILTLVPGV